MFKIKYFYLRVFSVIFDLMLGFVQTYIFIKAFGTGNSAFLLWVFGISTYLMFFDFGLTKVAYAKIRSNFLSEKDYLYEIRKTLNFLSYVWVSLLAVFSVIVYWASRGSNVSFDVFDLFMIALVIPLNILFGFLRQIFGAIDQFKKFEYFDILRKLINCIGLAAILITSILKSGFIFTVTGMILITGYMVYFLLYKHPDNTSDKSLKMKEPFDWGQIKTSFPVLVFTIAEVFIYNGGFVFLPMLKADNISIIYYSLFIKLFTAMAGFMRTVNDSYIPHQTRAYLTDNIPEAKNWIDKSIALSVLLCLFTFTCFLFLNKYFMYYWTSGKYQLPGFTLAALFFMLVGNALQHVSGSFLMDVGGNYLFLRNSAVFLFIIISTGFILTFHLTTSISATNLVTSVLYFLGSFIYFRKVKGLVA